MWIMDISIRVETGSGHLGQLGHILSGSSGSDPVYKNLIPMVWPRFYIKSCAVIMVSIPDQNNEMTVMMEEYLLIFLRIFWGIVCTIRVFRSFSAWIMQSHTPQKHRAPLPFSHHFIYNSNIALITHRGSITTAWKMLQKPSSMNYAQFMCTRVPMNKACWC